MIRNQSGQLTIEAVLIITIFASVMYGASRAMRDNNILGSLVEQPWSHVQGMIENGVWGPTDQGKGIHPNHISRHGSPSGDAP